MLVCPCRMLRCLTLQVLYMTFGIIGTLLVGFQLLGSVALKRRGHAYSSLRIATQFSLPVILATFLLIQLIVLVLVDSLSPSMQIIVCPQHYHSVEDNSP